MIINASVPHLQNSKMKPIPSVWYNFFLSDTIIVCKDFIRVFLYSELFIESLIHVLGTKEDKCFFFIVWHLVGEMFIINKQTKKQSGISSWNREEYKMRWCNRVMEHILCLIMEIVVVWISWNFCIINDYITL